MQKLKIYSDIKNEQDVETLITTIVLSQRTGFTRRHLVEAAKHSLPDSKVRVVVDDTRISNMVDRTLDTLHRNGRIRYQGRIIFPVNRFLGKKKK